MPHLVSTSIIDRKPHKNNSSALANNTCLQLARPKTPKIDKTTKLNVTHDWSAFDLLSFTLFLAMFGSQIADVLEFQRAGKYDSNSNVFSRIKAQVKQCQKQLEISSSFNI